MAKGKNAAVANNTAEVSNTEVIAAKTGNSVENVEAIAAAIAEKLAKKSPGRPVEPDSERQKRLAERNAKSKDGEVKRGRAIVPGSKRQQKLAEMEARKNMPGYTGKPGRPKSQETVNENVLILEASPELIEQAMNILKEKGVELKEGAEVKTASTVEI